MFDGAINQPIAGLAVDSAGQRLRNLFVVVLADAAMIETAERCRFSELDEGGGFAFAAMAGTVPSRTARCRPGSRHARPLVPGPDSRQRPFASGRRR